MPFINVPSDSEEYGEFASLLVAMAREADIHPREVKALPTGFEVPEALYAQLAPQQAQPLTDPRDEGKIPPPGWDEPLEPADVVFEGGKVYLTPPAEAALVGDGTVVVEVEAPKKPEAAAVRTWARENGIDVPVRGIVPQAVVDAYYEAHSGE